MFYVLGGLVELEHLKIPYRYLTVSCMCQFLWSIPSAIDHSVEDRCGQFFLPSIPHAAV